MLYEGLYYIEPYERVYRAINYPIRLANLNSYRAR